MAFKVPWHRENRPGIHEYNRELYPKPEYLNVGTFENSIVPRFEISATVPFFMRSGDSSCVGRGGTGGFRVASSRQWTDSVRAFSVGGQKVTQEYSNTALKQQTLSAVPPTKSASSVYWDYMTRYETTGPSVSIGGGIDLRLNPALAVRLGSRGLRSLLVEQTQWDGPNQRHPGEHGTPVTYRDLVNAVVTSPFTSCFREPAPTFDHLPRIGSNRRVGTRRQV